MPRPGRRARKIPSRFARDLWLEKRRRKGQVSAETRARRERDKAYRAKVTRWHRFQARAKRIGSLAVWRWQWLAGCLLVRCRPYGLRVFLRHCTPGVWRILRTGLARRSRPEGPPVHGVFIDDWVSIRRVPLDEGEVEEVD